MNNENHSVAKNSTDRFSGIAGGEKSLPCPPFGREAEIQQGQWSIVNNGVKQIFRKREAIVGMKNE
ncbi:MAG TPA: hypothetical protein VG842_10385 [Sediminibacterium sp.]|nr:hypothetical protein [Sediminibacterium sp.]